MNDHGVTNGKHDGPSAEELMVPEAGQRVLDRRRLPGGVVVGAAGLLLPGPGASAQVEGLFPLKPFRWELHNRQGDKMEISFYKSTYFGDPPQWIRIASGNLAPGEKWVLESPAAVDGYQPVSRLEFFFSGQKHTLEAINPFVGTPRITIDGKTQAPQEGKTFVWNFGNREVEVTRRADTNFKEYVVNFNKPDNQQRTKDDKDNNDKNNNDKNKRRRKR